MRLETLVARLVVATVPLAVAVGLVASALLLALSDLPRRATVRLAGWFAGGVLGFAGVAGWLFAHDLVHGAHLHHWPYLLVSTAAVGGFVGFTIGWYDARAWTAYGGTLSIEEGPDGVAFVVELPLVE
jgi:hypothetical protein